ncbi:sulfatase, partial [Thalassotalea crassostreae]
MSIANANDKPNFLFIAIDDLKPLTASYGRTDAITPNIEALADNGVVFQRAYSQYPVCGPSRMNLLTGLRPETNGILNLSDTIRNVNVNVVTLPQKLISEGYVTAAAGKIFDPRNVDDNYDSQSWSVDYIKVSGDVDKKTADNLAVKAIDAEENRFVDGKITNQGIALLQQFAEQEKPFFLAVGFKKPHLPFFAPKTYFDLYDANEFDLAEFQQLPTDSDASYVDSNSNELIKNYNPAVGQNYEFGNITPDQQRDLIHGYYASTSFIDAQVGLLIAALTELDLADNTVIVLWGDHGFHLGDHGLWGKHTVLEQANHIPLIINVPDSIAHHTNALIESTDIYPTILDIANIEIDEHLQGVSQLPVIKQEKLTVRNGAVSQYRRNAAMGYSLRTQNYRYTEWWNTNGSGIAYTELYDLNNDSDETVNIFDAEVDREIQQQLYNLLRDNGQGLELLQGEPKDVEPLIEEIAVEEESPV